VFDVVTAGHLSIDSIFLPDRPNPFVVLGGSPAYVSFAARRLDSTVSIISNVGADFPSAYRWWMAQEGVNISSILQRECSSTRFELEYDASLSSRILRLRSKASPIMVEDVPVFKAKAVHVAPIDREISLDVVEKLKGCAEVLSLDPQGLIRNPSEDGRIEYARLEDQRILDLISIYKSSEKELKLVTGFEQVEDGIKAVHAHGVKIVIVTSGVQGLLLSIEGTQYRVPAYTPVKVVDPTGAGDAFMGGFLAEYVYGENLFRCACVGAAVASLVVEGLGPTFFGDKETIYERARSLYEKEIKA
jgi:sugar/nucleoside kinase (ribokinase family)